MKSATQKAPRWLVGLHFVLCCASLLAIGYLCYTSNRDANKIVATYPKNRTTQIYLGQNLSTEATSITGSTVHLGYDDFVKHSSKAIETYLVRETPENSPRHDAAYALLPNGHTYSTILQITAPDNSYAELSRHIENDKLVVSWRLSPSRITILGGLLLFAAAFAAITLLTYGLANS